MGKEEETSRERERGGGSDRPRGGVGDGEGDKEGGKGREVAGRKGLRERARARSEGSMRKEWK